MTFTTRLPTTTRLVAALLSLPASAVAQDEAAPAAPAEDPAPGAVDEDEAFLGGGEAKPGAAEEAPADAAPADGTPGKWGGRKRDHDFQGFVNVLFGTGWYLVAPYDKNDPDKACSDLTTDPNDPNAGPEGDPVCAGRSPMHLDFLGGFGVKEGLEVFAMFRLGMPDPAADDHLPTQTRYLGAGIKTYSPEDGLFKISFGVAALFDFSNRRSETYDFVIHVPIAAHFDFIPWLGAYLQVAPDISFIAEFKLDITAGVGLQGRFP